ncbi:MAG TPA: hypothetical protein VFA59_17395 [Vicinamibacterales bacterium]|nr:hypothetical protein [Vicinamibacterales bacterium]
MPFRIEFDDAREWVLITVTDSLTAGDAVGVIRTVRADATHQMWPMLVDARGVPNSLSLSDIDQMVEAVRAAARASGLRGHVALIADTDSLFDRLLVYEVRCAQIGVGVIRVFRDERDARQWLETMSSAWKLGKT